MMGAPPWRPGLMRSRKRSGMTGAPCITMPAQRRIYSYLQLLGQTAAMRTDAGRPQSFILWAQAVVGT